MREWTHSILLFAKFHLDEFRFCRSWEAKNPNFTEFSKSTLRDVVVQRRRDKVERGELLQTSSYAAVSKPFLNSNGFMAIPLAKTAPFKSVTDEQKCRTSPPAACEVWALPKPWGGDPYCIVFIFQIWHMVSPRNWRKIHPHNFRIP